MEITIRTFELGAVDTAEGELSVSNTVRGEEQAEQGWESLLNKSCEEALSPSGHSCVRSISTHGRRREI